MQSIPVCRIPQPCHYCCRMSIEKKQQEQEEMRELREKHEKELAWKREQVSP